MAGLAGRTTCDKKQRSGSGRRKLDKLEIMEDRRAREVTFSKRRRGLFTKASEISVLCGAEIGIVVFSPCGNPFVFGQPDADVIFDRYLAGGSGSEYHCNRFFRSDFSQHKEEYERLMRKLGQMRCEQFGVLSATAENSVCSWEEMDTEILDMDVDELEHYIQWVNLLMNKVRDEQEKTTLTASELEFLCRECGFSC